MRRQLIALSLLFAFASVTYSPTFALAAPRHNAQPKQVRQVQMHNKGNRPSNFQMDKGSKSNFRSMADQERRVNPRLERERHRITNPSMHQFEKRDNRGPKHDVRRNDNHRPKDHIRHDEHRPPRDRVRHDDHRYPIGPRDNPFRHRPNKKPFWLHDDRHFYHGMYRVFWNGRYIVAPSSYWLGLWHPDFFVNLILQGLAYEVFYSDYHHRWITVPY